MTTFRYHRRLHTVPEPRRHSGRVQKGRARIIPVAGLVLVFLLGLLYVRQINTVATSGLQIKKLQEQQSQLQQESQELSLRIENLRSLATVERTSEELNLVAQAPVKYLPAVSSSVALAK